MTGLLFELPDCENIFVSNDVLSACYGGVAEMDSFKRCMQFHGCSQAALLAGQVAYKHTWEAELKLGLLLKGPLFFAVLSSVWLVMMHWHDQTKTVAYEEHHPYSTGVTTA